MHQTALQTLSIKDYLDGERESEIRHEYIAGQVYAMAGAGENHNLIALNVATWLRQQARGTPCRPFISDMKLYIAEAERFYYPDILLTCDPADTHEYYKQYPCLLVEVLSKSTETTDRREKLHAYKNIPGLQAYVLISQHQCLVEVYRRAGEQWQYIVLDSLDDVLTVDCVSGAMTLAEVYEDVLT